MTTQKTYAVIQNGTVVNLALAPSGWAPPSVTLIEVPDGVRAEIGDSANPDTWLVLAPPAVTTADYTRAVQAALDQKAAERNYDGILSACTYVTSNVPKFQAEGSACVAWRDAVWAYCYAVLAQVQAQTLPQPTVAELVAGMPQLTWPV